MRQADQGNTELSALTGAVEDARGFETMPAPLVPDKALSQHVIVLGKTRSGKSSTMRGFAERLLDDSKPVCIIDPKGDWWGLKSSADGKHAGYAVVIFGGEHADVPINEHSGAAVAELVATGNRPCIIDLGGWMPAARTRFFVDFASSLFRHTRGPRWLIIDEVHNFAPQGKVLDPDAGKMLHWTNRLANEGSGKGLTLISASQRPQKVHKDFVTANETLVAMRVIHPLDRGAIKDWVDGYDPKKGTEVLQSLAEMERGEGWVWSPEIRFGPVRMQFPMFKTYDSFKAPSGETVAKLKGWASVDLDDVRAKLAAVVEEAKANDPRALKLEVSRLKKELAAKPAAAPTERIVTVADPKAVEDAEVRGFNVGVEATRQAFVPKGHVLAAALDDMLKTLVPFKRPAAPPRIVPRTNGAAPPPRAAPRAVAPPPDGLTSSQMKVIEALAFWRVLGFDTPTRPQLAGAAGYASGSGNFNNILGGLRTNGLIDYPTPGTVTLTEAGAALAPEPDSRPPRERITPILSSAQIKIVDGLSDGVALSREELGERVGYQPGSGNFNNILGSLRTLGIIGYPAKGQVAIEPWVLS